jgi:hypothetical protein
MDRESYDSLRWSVPGTRSVDASLVSDYICRVWSRKCSEGYPWSPCVVVVLRSPRCSTNRAAESAAGVTRMWSRNNRRETRLMLDRTPPGRVPVLSAPLSRIAVGLSLPASPALDVGEKHYPLEPVFERIYVVVESHHQSSLVKALEHPPTNPAMIESRGCRQIESCFRGR